MSEEIKNPDNIETKDAITSLTDEQKDALIKEVEALEKTEEMEDAEVIEELPELPVESLSVEGLSAKMIAKSEKKQSSVLTLSEKHKMFGEKGLFNPQKEEMTFDDGSDDYRYYNELCASRNSGLFLRGVVTGVAYTENHDDIYLIIPKGTFEVHIPVREFWWMGEKKNYTEKDLATWYSYAIKRIGSEVDFCVIEFIPSERYAIASRLQAMGIKAVKYYVKPNPATGKPQINVGSKVRATVVGVTSSFVICEAYGAEFQIREEELGYERIDGIDSQYHIGDSFPVKILSVNFEVIKDGNRNYKICNVTASKKQAQRNNQAKYFSKLVLGQVSLATVDYIYNGMISVSLGTKGHFTMRNVLCNDPINLPSSERPHKGDVVLVSIVKLNEEKQTAKAHFLNVVKRA